MQLISEEYDNKMAPDKLAAEFNKSTEHLRELRRALDDLKSGKIGLEDAKQILQEISTHYEPEIREEEARQAAARQAAAVPEEASETSEVTTYQTEATSDTFEETTYPVAAEEEQETTDRVEETLEITEPPVDVTEEALETADRVEEVAGIAEPPGDIAEMPADVAEAAVEKEEDSTTEIQALADIEEEPIAEAQPAVEAEEEPIAEAQPAVEAEEEPIAEAQPAVEVEEEPAVTSQTFEETAERLAATTQPAGETEEERLFREAVKLERSEEKEVFQGNFDIKIAPPVDPLRMRDFQKRLKAVSGLKILMVTGSEDGGIGIAISASSPVALISVIRQMPPVSQVSKTGSIIEVALRDRQ